VSDPLLRFVGSLDALQRVPELRQQLLERAMPDDASVRATTTAILERVRAEGDAALRALSRELDGAEVETLEVSRASRRRALDELAIPLRAALERAAANIATAHHAFLPVATEIETEPGVLVGRRPDPLDAVGVYAPGGRGAYPSSVLMGVVPARIARVRTVILCSPPGRDGLPSRVVLAAAEIAGADRVFSIGGAGAIGALAFGTESVPRVCRIVGPGNAYVSEAKLQVQASGAVAIDSPAGPSELLVIADATADPETIAREMAAQAEHDPWTSVVLITDSQQLARTVVAALHRTVPTQRRAHVIREALRQRSAVLWVDSLHEAVGFAAEYAPEHLLLAGIGAEALLDDVRNAGTVFVGEQSSVVYGDYMSGANHVLPTGGTARSYSGLSTGDFMRWTTYQRISRSGASVLAADVATIADAEQLAGHARAARAWEESA
jgi:histidinol dehydrogenase